MLAMRRKIQQLCVLTGGYPTPTDPLDTFVEQLVFAFADLGIRCTVVNPQSLTTHLLRGQELRPRRRVQYTPNGSRVDVISPRYCSASVAHAGPVNMAHVTISGFLKAAQRGIRALPTEFDAFYGHFIYPGGIAAAHFGREYQKPGFFAYGENTNYTIDYLGRERTRAMLEPIRGVVAVSSANKSRLIAQGVVPPEKVAVFPNAIDGAAFYRHDRLAMRRKYHIPEDAFVLIFVGRFVEIKGADRLSAAIDKLRNGRIKSLFIGGQGKVGPHCSGILMAGEQPHKNIPELLSAADVFVLPTLAEGCCNSILEAMACGLPVISSNLPFNDDILDDTCSIRIDPGDVGAIAAAIEKIFGDEALRRSLADGAVQKAATFSLDARARKIVDYMESRI